jgi:hypothetical protein
MASANNSLQGFMSSVPSSCHCGYVTLEIALGMGEKLLLLQQNIPIFLSDSSYSLIEAGVLEGWCSLQRFYGGRRHCVTKRSSKGFKERRV